ncbi:MAG: CDP-alcohol phosphatidyltransferase family protein [Clostridia bacterium]|nr:CDP-alcohol phosphatidyltransferase family protein [Clostridia bacterium]
MIGFYDYTIILTFLSLVSSVFGMTQVMAGHFQVAILCLAASGLCDAFDGKVARTKKNRTADEVMFGIQLDSLVDVFCFGIFPAMICYKLGVHGYLGGIAISYYCICAVIRLSFFNVLEINRQKSDDHSEKVFRGLPVTTISIVLPLLFLFEFLMSEQLFTILLLLMLFVVGTCFILDFRVKRLSNLALGIFIGLVAIAVVVILLFSKFNLPGEEGGNIFQRFLEGLRG